MTVAGRAVAGRARRLPVRSGRWPRARATSSSSSPPSSPTARLATSRGRPPTTSATRREFEVSVDGLVHARAAGRGRDRRPLPGRPGDQPAGLPRRPPGLRLARRRRRASRRRAPSSPSSRPSGSIPRPRPTIRCSSAGRISTPSAACPIPPRRAPSWRPDPREAEQAGRSPGRPPRVRRLLGAQVGRPAPQRREDDGREGRLGLPALAARRVCPAMSRSTSWSAGSWPGWARPGRIPPRASTGPIATRRRPRRASARSSSASASSAPAATTTRSTSGPRTTTTAWRRSSRNIARKELDNVRKDNLDKHEINGDEIIYLAGPPGWCSRGPARALQPTVLHGRPTGPADGDNALVRLADWLTRDNRQFDRNLANRVWFHLLGRGIVEPVDDFRDSNPPSNPGAPGRGRRRTSSTTASGSSRWSPGS